jgi:hypothetical protein
MLRRCYTGLSAVFLAVASAQAPFAHLHPGDPEHHHARGFAHSHLPPHAHASEQPEWESHEDDEAAVYLDWAPTAAPRAEADYAEAATPWIWGAELVSAGAAPEFEPRAHSPPGRLLLPARSPPL